MCVCVRLFLGVCVFDQLVPVYLSKLLGALCQALNASARQGAVQILITVIKPAADQNIALHASPPHWNLAFVIAAFPVYSVSFFHSPLQT